MFTHPGQNFGLAFQNCNLYRYPLTFIIGNVFLRNPAVERRWITQLFDQTTTFRAFDNFLDAENVFLNDFLQFPSVKPALQHVVVVIFDCVHGWAYSFDFCDFERFFRLVGYVTFIERSGGLANSDVIPDRQPNSSLVRVSVKVAQQFFSSRCNV